MNRASDPAGFLASTARWRSSGRRRTSSASAIAAGARAGHAQARPTSRLPAAAPESGESFDAVLARSRRGSARPASPTGSTRGTSPTSPSRTVRAGGARRDARRGAERERDPVADGARVDRARGRRLPVGRVAAGTSGRLARAHRGRASTGRRSPRYRGAGGDGAQRSGLLLADPLVRREGGADARHGAAHVPCDRRLPDAICRARVDLREAALRRRDGRDDRRRRLSTRCR